MWIPTESFNNILANKSTHNTSCGIKKMAHLSQKNIRILPSLSGHENIVSCPFYILRFIRSIITMVTRNYVYNIYNRIIKWMHFEIFKKFCANSTQCSQAVTHPSTNRAQHCLTSVIGRELVCSMWYGRWRKVGGHLAFILFCCTLLNSLRYLKSNKL